MKSLESPKFEWGFWITLIFGVTFRSILAGFINGQIKELFTGVTTAILAATVSAILGGIILELRFLYRKKYARVKISL